MYQLGYGTLSTLDLGLPTRNITQSGLSYQDEPHKIYFNPSVPYVYLNNDDWLKMKEAFSTRYTDQFECLMLQGQCFFTTSCDKLKSKAILPADVLIELEGG